MFCLRGRSCGGSDGSAFRGQDLGDVEGADRRAGTVEAAVDLHEAGVVEGGDDLGSGLDDAAVFFGEHGGGDVGVFDGEGAAEAATLVLVG
jgi:hypothetical protein